MSRSKHRQGSLPRVLDADQIEDTPLAISLQRYNHATNVTQAMVKLKYDSWQVLPVDRRDEYYVETEDGYVNGSTVVWDVPFTNRDRFYDEFGWGDLPRPQWPWL